MRDELRTALEALVEAVRTHAEAATVGTRPDVPDPLPQATTGLVEAVAAYTEAVERSTGAYVPWAVPEPRVGGAPDDPEPTRLEVVGRWTYEIPSVARLLAHAGGAEEDRPAAALHDLLHRRGHPLRWVAPDLVVHDRSVVGVFAAGDGSYVDEPPQQALTPPPGAALYASADLPAVPAVDDDVDDPGAVDPVPDFDEVDWAGGAERWR